MAKSGLVSCVSDSSLGCHIVKLSQFPSACYNFRRTFYLFACAWFPDIQQSAENRGVFCTHSPNCRPPSICAGKWQVNSNVRAAGPAFQDEQNLGVFQGLLRTLFTTKREFIIAFKDHHLRASLFIRVEPGYFFGELHCMTSPMSAAWWPLVCFSP